MNQSGENIQQDTSGVYGNDYFIEFKGKSFSSFYFMRHSGAVPVTFLSFSAQCNSNAVLLEWATASEQNNAGFEIEKSSDGSKFNKIAFVKGAGNANIQHNYTFSDGLRDGLKWLYRLRQIDKDGKFQHSKIVAASCNESAAAFKIFPNPVSSELVLEFDRHIKNGVVQITDFSGGEHLRIILHGGLNGTLKIRAAPLPP